jgi:hypothetical protein
MAGGRPGLALHCAPVAAALVRRWSSRAGGTFRYLVGAGRVIVVDHVDYRLDFVRRYAPCEIINFREVSDVALHIKKMTDWLGADVCIDAVGCEASGSLAQTITGRWTMLQAGAAAALFWAINSVRKGETCRSLASCAECGRGNGHPHRAALQPGRAGAQGAHHDCGGVRNHRPAQAPQGFLSPQGPGTGGLWPRFLSESTF